MQLLDVAADQPLARVALARIERRRVEIEQDRRAFGRQLGQRLDVVELVPHVLADRHAEPRRRRAARDVDRLAPPRRREIALVVEVAIVGEQRLVRALQNPAVAHDGGGVVLQQRAVLVALRRIVIDESDDRGDPVIQLSPPLIVGPQEIEEMRSILRQVLEEAWKELA